MDQSWILLGIMGAGKTTLGRELAASAGRTFVDTDQLIQNKVCRPISQIFKLYGEETFREHETSVLRDLLPGSTVLSTGGGIVLRPENWTELRRLGMTIYLRVSLPTLLTRLAAGRKRRPLLEDEAWEAQVERLLQARSALYEQADLVFDVADLPILEATQALRQAIDSRA